MQELPRSRLKGADAGRPGCVPDLGQIVLPRAGKVHRPSIARKLLRYSPQSTSFGRNITARPLS
ncbi:hypothetical protein [Paenarthrobacter nitroguajacolicus]|uniref:hypothetical protein n=1 Tax=Paenarthrobacter nitroguajacolicus TaxID=211146 RepID=UPI0040547DCC